MPPDVPAIVNAGVVVAVATETMPPVQLTLVTVPLVAGDAQDGALPVVAVKTCPVVPAAEEAQVDALEKYGTPPLVPATVRARVPELVIGDPATEIRPPVNDWATLVTVPDVTEPLDAEVMRPCWSTVMFA